MTGRIIHVPDAAHTCQPPAKGEWVRPDYWQENDHYRDGTVWQCDCGRTWIAAPLRWRPEGRIARWRRHRAAQGRR